MQQGRHYQRRRGPSQPNPDSQNCPGVAVGAAGTAIVSFLLIKAQNLGVCGLADVLGCRARIISAESWHELVVMSCSGNIHPGTTIQCKMRHPRGSHCIPVTFPLCTMCTPPLPPAGIGGELSQVATAPLFQDTELGSQGVPSVQPLVSTQANESPATPRHNHNPP